MLVFALRRLLQAIPILFGVSLVVFGLVHIVPGNPIDMLMPPEASPEVIAQMKAAFGFDKPLYMQYILWLLRAMFRRGTLRFIAKRPAAFGRCLQKKDRKSRQAIRL